MASQEMLKKLLDEFVEKEALITEELTVVSEQIEELEARLELCRARLGTIGTDRNKVVEIKSRYAGLFYQREVEAPSVVPTAQPQVQPAQPKPQPQAQQAQPKAQTQQKAQPDAKMVPPEFRLAPADPKPQPQAQPAQPQQPAQQQPQAFSDPVAAALSPLVNTVPPVISPRTTQTGINAILSSRKEPVPGADQPAPAKIDPATLEPTQPISAVQPQANVPPPPEPAPPVPQPQPPAPQTPPPPEPAKEEQPEDDLKSINDALRSLFR